jgi:hypothetical protein
MYASTRPTHFPASGTWIDRSLAKHRLQVAHSYQYLLSSSHLILFSALVRSLISCSGSTLLMSVMWGAYIAPSITITCLIAVVCYIATALCFIDRRCFTQLGGVDLMNQIRCIIDVGLDIFHPIPYHHSNMLRSDCSRLVGRPRLRVSSHYTSRGWSDQSHLTCCQWWRRRLHS